MLEISGAPQIAVSARLEAVSRTGRVLSSAPLPVVGSANLVPRGTMAQLQGIGRTTTGVQHRFGLINLGAKEAACTVAAYRAEGTPVGPTSRLTAPARSHNTLQSELGTAEELRGDGGGGEDKGGRGGKDGGEDDNGGGNDGGDGDDTSGSVVVGQNSLSFPGLFLNARQGNSYRAFELPLRPGVRYKRVTIDFDLYLHKWVNPLFHVVTALRRNDRTLYAGLIVRGDRAKTVLDLGKDELARDTGPWKQRTNYHVHLVTDAQTRQVTLQLFQAGKLVHTLAGRLTTPDLSVSAQTRMRVDFGGTKVADGAYFPPVGWKYSNLVVKAEPF